MMELYSDFLISSFGQTSATMLAQLLLGEVSHDQVTRFLRQEEAFSRTLWKLAKPLVRQIEQEDGTLSVDDCVIPKPHSQENGVVEWHYDHTTGRTIRGICFITAFYGVTTPDQERLGVPVAGEVIVKKPVWDEKKQNSVMKSPITKNEHYRHMLAQCKANGVKFKYVLNDTWYTNPENMTFVVERLGKHFVMATKENMSILICDESDVIQWKGKMRDLDIAEGQVREVYINGIDFPVYVSRHVFKNEDGSSGILYLCSDDSSLTANETLAIYQKRWPVEEFHKSLKQNASLGKSPASTPACQIKHILCSFYGHIKLEKLKIIRKENHFAMRTKMYIAALKTSYEELQRLRQQSENFQNSAA
jgi:hypothetical protein